jgi:hypothetical protein
MFPAASFDIREPSLAACAAGLDAAHLRWSGNAAGILSGEGFAVGSFRTADAYEIHGMTVVAGSGAFAGWQLYGYSSQGPRQGYYLSVASDPGAAPDTTVGFVMANPDGSWTACHDPDNHCPGVAPGCSGAVAVLSSANEACRYIVSRHAWRCASQG